MIKKLKSSMSVKSANLFPPDRDTTGVGNAILRSFKKNLPAKFPMPAKKENGKTTTFTFTPDRKLKTTLIVAAIVNSLPSSVNVEINGDTVTFSVDSPIGITYQESLIVVANDADPESKIFTVLLAN